MTGVDLDIDCYVIGGEYYPLIHNSVAVVGTLTVHIAEGMVDLKRIQLIERWTRQRL